MEAISFVRNFRSGSGWETTSITEEESNTLQEQLRKLNNQIYEGCLRDAHEMLKRFIVPYSNPMPQIQQAADRLFKKRTIHSLTAYQEFLKAKVQMLRNGNNGNGSSNGQVINGNGGGELREIIWFGGVETPTFLAPIWTVSFWEVLVMNETDTHQDMADFKPPTRAGRHSPFA
jgi:hypothetical protein